MNLVRVTETIESALTANDAASGTFYIRDPFWQGELRLIAMPGVQYPEPMHGFSFPPHPNKVLTEGEIEIFSDDSPATQQLREDAESGLDKISRKKKFLFGDFVEREGIKSSARLLHKVDGKIRAVLFVNFVKKQLFDERLKQKLRKLLDELVSDLPGLEREVRASETDSLVQAIRMFPPTYAGSATNLSEWYESLKKSLDSLLDMVVQALQLELNTTFGTIHLYDRRTKTLRLEAQIGDIKNTQLAQSLSVPKGDGIISWVAIRRKALLITDLKQSKLGKMIHLPFNKDVRSEVAIPIFAGRDLLGVLNLESFREDSFQPSCVRSLWFAVNRAAVAYRLSQQASINSRLKELNDGLLDLCAECVDQGTGSFSLDKLALLATKHLDATRCDIWRYDAHSTRFELAGKSYADFQPEAPRKSGWSDSIRQSGDSVWIHDIRTSNDFKIKVWRSSGWVPPPTDQSFPRTLNTTKGRRRVKSLLSIPIRVRGQFIGVAWLENEDDQEAAPGNELMKLATGFAAHAGLVIEFSQVDLVDKNAVQRIGGRLSENLLASGPLNLEGFGKKEGYAIEGYAKSEPFPHSRIGGDFYAARVIDERTAGVLVGDGEGHAVKGALNMLPMLAVFEAFWKSSRSAAHIMDRIMDTSNKLGVMGTAIYCVFRLIKDSDRKERLWLSVSAAGHPPLVIFKKDGSTFPFPGEKDPASGGMLGAMITSPLAEQQQQLSIGDLIIICTDGLDLTINEIEGIGRSNENESNQRIAQAVFQKALDKRNSICKSVEDDQTVLVIRVASSLTPISMSELVD